VSGRSQLSEACVSGRSQLSEACVSGRSQLSEACVSGTLTTTKAIKNKYDNFFGAKNHLVSYVAFELFFV
jgi:hypothetical protein